MQELHKRVTPALVLCAPSLVSSLRAALFFSFKGHQSEMTMSNLRRAIAKSYFLHDLFLQSQQSRLYYIRVVCKVGGGTKSQLTNTVCVWPYIVASRTQTQGKQQENTHTRLLESRTKTEQCEPTERGGEAVYL